MKVALDTNVLAYAEGVNDAPKRDRALALIRNLPPGAAVLPVQVLGELFNVLIRKAGRSRSQAREALLAWHDSFPVIETSSQAMLAAAELATDHQLSLWDAVILCVCSQAGCRLLLSEDMQNGFTWCGVTVVNPFAAEPHPLLKF